MEIESSEISMLLSFTMFYIPAIWHGELDPWDGMGKNWSTKGPTHLVMFVCIESFWGGQWFWPPKSWRWRYFSEALDQTNGTVLTGWYTPKNDTSIKSHTWDLNRHWTIYYTELNQKKHSRFPQEVTKLSTRSYQFEWLTIQARTCWQWKIHHWQCG